MTFADEFLQDGIERAMIDEYFEEELKRAGYAGMDIEDVPGGINIVLRAEKPGMVIGKGGSKIREMTEDLESEFSFEDLSIDVQDVESPLLYPRIVAEKLANSLERGWYFRQAGMTTIEDIMDEGARGARIRFAGKLTGARSRVEKFERGYVKHSGEPAENIVREGKTRAIMPLGSIGVKVMIIPPNVTLPDQFTVDHDVDVDSLVGDDLADLLTTTTDEQDDQSDDDEADEDGNDSPDEDHDYQEEIIG